MNDKAARAAVTANKPSAASQMVKVAAKKTNKDHAKLPQTGNRDSVAAMAMGAVLAMFGLGVGMKKRQD